MYVCMYVCVYIYIYIYDMKAFFTGSLRLSVISCIITIISNCYYY